MKLLGVMVVVWNRHAWVYAEAPKLMVLSVISSL
jgi:hypothetical protein